MRGHNSESLFIRITFNTVIHKSDTYEVDDHLLLRWSLTPLVILYIVGQKERRLGDE